MATSKKVDDQSIEITLQIEQERIEFCIVGRTPLVLNRMSQKAREGILSPSGRVNAAERQSTLKHNPPEEFAASPYTLRDADAPTYLAQMASAFKGAMLTAALDIPGAYKTRIGRLTWVVGDLVPIYGEPQLSMAVVRQADVNHTPDIRTRVIVPEWAALVRVDYATPLLRQRDVFNLMATAGLTAGIGDWRPEKGKGSYGQFLPVPADDPQFIRITETWGRAQQLSAMASPRFYDAETEELFTWWQEDAKRRGFKAVKEVA